MMDQEWPWEYDFPPFFTIQPNETTRKIQLSVWCKLVLQYFKNNKKHILDVNEEADSPLFSNKKINRSLPREGILKVLEGLEETGKAQALDKTRKRWVIYWHSPGEWGDLLTRWAEENGHLDSVCTFYELQTADGAEFAGMPTEVLTPILRGLESRGKAELILDPPDLTGVKFL